MTRELFPFLNLPFELREQILGEVFFPSESQPEETLKNEHPLSTNASRPIFPFYRMRDGTKFKIDTAIMRTCHQLQPEAEQILYSTSSWLLTCENVPLLENLPRRLRKLIRNVELSCGPLVRSSTLWAKGFTFLAHECLCLQSLKLHVFDQPVSLRVSRLEPRRCLKDEEWVIAVLQIKALTFFDIRPVGDRVMFTYPNLINDFLPWMRVQLLARPHRVLVCKENQIAYNRGNGQSSFLDLPLSIRKRVYRYALLPADKRIHPSIRSWYDKTTQDLLPILLSCTKVHDEATEFFYSQAIFTSSPGHPDYPHNNHKFLLFLCELNPRLLKLIQHVVVKWHWRSMLGPTTMSVLTLTAKFMQLRSLSLGFSNHVSQELVNRMESRLTPFESDSSALTEISHTVPIELILPERFSSFPGLREYVISGVLPVV